MLVQMEGCEILSIFSGGKDFTEIMFVKAETWEVSYTCLFKYYLIYVERHERLPFQITISRVEVENSFIYFV